MAMMNPQDLYIDNAGVAKEKSSSSVVHVQKKLELDINTSLPDEAAFQQEELLLCRSDKTITATLSSSAASSEDEQVVSRIEEQVSEVVVVPQVAKVITSEVIQQIEQTTCVGVAAVVPSSCVSSSPSKKDSRHSTPVVDKWKEVESVFSPPIDIVELKDSYHLYAEVPGMSVKDISIDLSNNLFTLTGDKRDHPLLSRKNKAEEVVKQEINKGRFKRVLELPDDVDTDGVNVAYEGGILQFKIRKIEHETEEEEETEETEAGVEATIGNITIENLPVVEEGMVVEEGCIVLRDGGAEAKHDKPEEQRKEKPNQKRRNRRKKSSCLVQ